jgi:flavodoxin
MKAIIIYFTMTGRTKKIAEAIASSLTNYEVEFIPFELGGSLSERLKITERFNKGNFLKIEEQLSAVDNVKYDLLFIGMPTHGNFPPKAFEEILVRLGDLSGKKGVAFNTARLTGGKSLDYMETKMKDKGAEVIYKKRFKSLFRLGVKKAIKFGEQINKKILN